VDQSIPEHVEISVSTHSHKKLSLQYCLTLSANTNNPAYNAVFNFKSKTQFDRKPSQTRPLGFRVAAVVAANSVKTVRLSDNASTYTAELHALNMALGIMRRITESLRFSPYKPSSNWSYETHQLVSSKKAESIGMSNLPFSYAHSDRLHLFWCSKSDTYWSWHTERTFLKMSKLETL